MRFDDSDIKIAPDDPSEVFDTSEGAAAAFAREKANGNMEKARALGVQFAAELTADERGIVYFGIGAFDSAETLSQRKVLFSYLVGRVIEDMAPNSIVAQSAMSAYYDELQRVSGETYGLVSDSAALSLYILAGRSSPDDIGAVGRVFARLCGRKDAPVFVRYGSELTSYFAMYCTQLALRAQLIR